MKNLIELSLWRKKAHKELNGSLNVYTGRAFSTNSGELENDFVAHYIFKPVPVIQEKAPVMELKNEKSHFPFFSPNNRRGIFSSFAFN